MKKSLLLIVAIAGILNTAFAQKAADLTVCHGTGLSFRGQSGTTIEVYIKDTASSPIIVTTFHYLEANLKDSVYFVHKIYHDTALGDEWRIISVFPALDPNFSFVIDGLTVHFHPKQGEFDSWYFGDGVEDYNTDSPIHTYKTPGTYIVTHTVVDTNGCYYTLRDTITVPATDIETEMLKNTISIYPNPVKGKLIISGEKFDEGTYQIEIYNTTGQLITVKSLSLPASLDVSGLKKGVYTIRLYIQKVVLYERFVKL